MSHPSSNRYSYTEVLERTVIIFKKHIQEIAILSTIFYSLGSSFTLTFGAGGAPIFCILILILISYLFVIFQLHEDKKSIDLDQLLFRKKYLNNLLKIIKPFILITIFLILLSFLLLIPALIFGVLWSFWELIALEKNLKSSEIIEYSKKLVSGNWWYVFTYFIITFFVSNFPATLIESALPDNPLTLIISNIFTGFITSFFIIGFFVIYRNLQKISH